MNPRSGQATMLLVLALALFLLGAVGFSVESSLYYTHRQMAQAAADSAAEAAMASIFSGTNTAALTNSFGGGAYTCTASDQTTPCAFARMQGFGPAANETVEVSFPAAGTLPGVALAPDLTPSAVSVNVTRTFDTIFLPFVGANTATVAATGIAAAMLSDGPVAILVMHPDEDDAFFTNGGPTIRICGGPPRSIQVNSVNSAAVGNTSQGGGNGTVLIDLSRAGPPISPPPPAFPDGFCPIGGSGGEFGHTGGPEDWPGNVNRLLPVGAYPFAERIRDPLVVAGMAEPTVPATIGTRDPTPRPGLPGSECDRRANRSCTVFNPGNWVGGIQIANEYALFRPGLYYLNGGGLTLGAQSVIHTTCDTGPVPGFGCGVMIYNDPQNPGDALSFGANSGKIQGQFPVDADFPGGPCAGNCVVGPTEAGPYHGVVFMNDRTTPFAQTHTLGGGAGIGVNGTIYLTNSSTPFKDDLAGSDQYQRLQLQGNPGSSTTVSGMIIVDALSMGGNPVISMDIPPAPSILTHRIALVR